MEKQNNITGPESLTQQGCRFDALVMPPSRILDLFCKAGGASMGLHQAFPDAEIFGVDKDYQKNYPFNFIQADAMTFDLNGYDFIWASPPCQFYSNLTPQEHKSKHPALIGSVRKRLQKTKSIWIIENVNGAKKHLYNPIMLCGTQFGLNTHRHRYFESPWLDIVMMPSCDKSIIPVVVSGTSKRLFNGKRREFTAQECGEAMQINWMTRKELDEAIPPAFSKYLIAEIYRRLQIRAA